MKNITQAIVLVAAIFGGIVLFSAAYTVSETQQVIITQFGKPVGEPITEAGLHFKTPFIQDVNVVDKRVLDWDGYPNEMPTKDKTFIVVDTFARWQIKDAKQYFLRLRDERSARSRLDDIIRSETLSAIANHELTEVVRSTENREAATDPSTPGMSTLRDIEKGRGKIEDEILAAAAVKLDVFGIELLDVRFKRINYHSSVEASIFQRMISERKQIAERYRSEGQGEAAKITGRRGRDLLEIESEAYRTVLEIKGRADAKASEVYANAYNQNAQSVEFYEFIKSLEAFQVMLDKDTSLVLTTDSDLFKYLKSIQVK